MRMHTVQGILNADIHIDVLFFMLVLFVCMLIAYAIHKTRDSLQMDMDNRVGIYCGRGMGWVEQGKEGTVGQL